MGHGERIIIKSKRHALDLSLPQPVPLLKEALLVLDAFRLPLFGKIPLRILDLGLGGLGRVHVLVCNRLRQFCPQPE